MKTCNPFNLFVALIMLLFFMACRKDMKTDLAIAPGPVTITDTLPDLSTKVSSSVSGFVTDENNVPVSGASVKAGDATTISDNFGFFELKDIQVIAKAATVTVTYSGYFKGIKTYIATGGKSAFFRIKLIPKIIAGNINAQAGGTVTLSGGLVISIPAGSVVNASTTAAYTGNINVAAYWINPDATDLNQVMPGDLRGLNDSGFLKILKTYGMAAIELTGASGELLQIVPGKKAGITMPLSPAISASAPASIPLWYMDENNGLWREEGIALKQGNTYVGEVTHFSFWDYDVPGNYVQLDCTFLNSNGSPLAYALVDIYENTNNGRYGWTDASGYISGAVPANSQLFLGVFANPCGGTATYQQSFSTSNTAVSLGTITIPAINANYADITATITDCNSSPVTNGNIFMLKNSAYYRYPTDAAGAVQFTTLLCSPSQDVTFVAEDIIGNQQSAPVNYVLATGANNVGNLQACGITAEEFIDYSFDGADTLYTPMTDSLYMGTWLTSYISIGGNVGQPGVPRHVDFNFSSAGISSGSTQLLERFQNGYITTYAPASPGINVNISEYGAVGEFIAGDFNGTLLDAFSMPHTITLSFRVRRTQ